MVGVDNMVTCVWGGKKLLATWCFKSAVGSGDMVAAISIGLLLAQRCLAWVGVDGLVAASVGHGLMAARKCLS